jgi:hypothetical protein
MALESQFQFQLSQPLHAAIHCAVRVAFNDLNQFPSPQIIKAVLNLKIARLDMRPATIERAMNLCGRENSVAPKDQAADRAGHAALLENEMGDCPDSLIAHDGWLRIISFWPIV